MLRPMRPEDVPGALRVFEAAMPAPAIGWRDDDRVRVGRRLRRALADDPGGTWVAEEDCEVAGVSIGLCREGIWVLSFLAVDTGRQGGGLGRALFDRAHALSEGCRGGLITASDDPRARRLYAAAGFSLREAITARGMPGRREAAGVREGGAGDLDHADAVDRAVRGGARRADLEAILASGDVDFHIAPSGYALGGRGTLRVLAALEVADARALLWRVLADTPHRGEAEVGWVTGEQAWALELLDEAGLRLERDGAVCARGELGPLHPYLPNGAYL